MRDRANRFIGGTMTALAVVLILGICSVSVALNARFGWTLGTTDFDRMVYATGSGLADAVKAALALAVVAAWRSRQVMRALLGCVMLVTFVALSLASSVGFASHQRDSMAAERRLEAAKLATRQAEIQRLRAERAALPKHRPAAAVKAALAGERTNYRWTSTRGCTDVTAPKSRVFCADLAALRSELATAERAAELDRRIWQISTEIQQTRTAATAKADPQAAALAAVTGVELDRVGPALAVLMAGVIELGSAFGLFVLIGGGPAARRVEAQESRRESQPDSREESQQESRQESQQESQAKTGVVEVAEAVEPPPQVQPIPEPEGQAIDVFERDEREPEPEPEPEPERQTLDPNTWADATLVSRPGARIGAQELHRAYAEAAERQGLDAVSPQAFGRAMKRQGLRKRRIAGRYYYESVAVPLAVVAA